MQVPATDGRGFSVMMLRDLAKSAVGRSQAFRKGLPEVALCTLMLFFLYTYLFAGNVMVSSQPTNLLKCVEGPAQQGGQGAAAITGANSTATYNPLQWNLLGSTSNVSGSFSNLAANDSANAFLSSYDSGANNTTFNYFPNNASSDVDGNGNLGTQSNFTALSYGPDGIMDTLTEGRKDGSNEQWLLPTGWEDPSSAWTVEAFAYDNYTETASRSSVDADSWGAYLVLNTSAITCGKIQCYVGHSDGHINRAQIDIYNGTWVNIYDGNGPWNKWSNVSFASTSVTQMRIRFYNNDHSRSNTAYIFEAQFLQNAVPQSYQLDLEAQWTGVNYTMANEWLCIYGGTMSTENLLVDVWNGSGWSNVIANVSSGWNNLSVASYLVSSTFTVRFRDATPSDPAPNSWQVDTCLLARPPDNGTSTSGFDWKWALLIAPAAVLLFSGFMWRRRNGAKKFRSFEYFDEITNGGIPDSFSVLITGGPGSGKSMLCQELAHAFLIQKKSCLYVTYDCFPDEVRDNLGKFHDEISTYEAEKKLLFMDCFSATSKNKDREYYLGQSLSLADLGIVMSEATSDLGPSPKIVLDSITPLITHVEPLKVIEFLQDRGARIKGVSGTFIFTIGKATIEPNLANRLEETVDCIIELDESTNKRKTGRRLRVKKMRGKKTSDKWVRFEIEPKKGIMFPT